MYILLIAIILVLSNNTTGFTQTINKVGSRYIETKTVEIDRGTSDDIIKAVKAHQEMLTRYEVELAGYEEKYASLITGEQDVIDSLQSNFKDVLPVELQAAEVVEAVKEVAPDSKGLNWSNVDMLK